jgi:hypothetical protein
MSMPVMGTETPLTKKAVEDAERVCPTDSHRYGYLISFAQKMELDLADAQKACLAAQEIAIERGNMLLAGRGVCRQCGYTIVFKDAPAAADGSAK